jgi:hypothetical protein
MRAWLLIATLFCTLSAAEAQEVDTGHAGSCETFLRKYNENPKFAEGFYLAWAHGFLVGLNAGVSPKDRRNLAALNIREQIPAIQKFCDIHPLVDYSEAVSKLWFDLPKLAPRVFRE